MLLKNLYRRISRENIINKPAFSHINKVDSIRREMTAKLGTFCLALLLIISVSAAITGTFTGAEADLQPEQEEDHLLTVNLVEGEGSIEVEWDGESHTVEDEDSFEISHGTEVTLTAEPDEEDVEIWWTGAIPEDENREDEITITMDEAKTVRARFLEKINLSLQVFGQGNVTIEYWDEREEDWLEVEESPVSSDDEMTQQVWKGIELRIEADPDEDHRLERWEGVPYDEDEEYFEITVEEDLDIEAHFEEILYQTLDLEITDGGRVVIRWVHEEYDISRRLSYSDDTEIRIEQGSKVTLEAEPEMDFELVEWTGDIEDTDDIIEFDMDSDMQITANFDEESRFPGFTMTLLLPAIALAVLIYHKKER